MRRLLLLAFLLRPFTASAAAGKSVDLSAQFPGAAVRNQGATNTCHVFSTVALLEAALHRRWGLKTALSEADLFVRKVIKDPAYYQKVTEAIGRTLGTEPAYRFVEWGSAADDIAFAVANGIAKAETAPWPAFVKRYEDFKAGQLEALRAKDDHLLMLRGAAAQVDRDAERTAARDMAIRSDYFAGVNRANFSRIKAQIRSAQYAEEKSFQSFLNRIKGKTHAEAEALLLGASPALAEEHALLKTLLAGMRVDVKTFDSKELRTEDACRAAGAGRGAILAASFDRGIPAGLSMDVGALKEWGVSDGPASHAFTVTGYTTDAAGRVSLQSRNSWGGKNPPVPDSRFCRISRIVRVLTPAERP